MESYKMMWIGMLLWQEGDKGDILFGGWTVVVHVIIDL